MRKKTTCKTSQPVLDLFSVLKKTIEDLARQSNFIKRRRKVTGLSFLLALTCGLVPSASPSVETICNFLSVSISRQGIQKRFTRSAVAFLKGCLELLLARIASLTPTELSTVNVFSRVLMRICALANWQMKSRRDDVQ